MAKASKEQTDNDCAVAACEKPRSVEIASGGFHTTDDIARFGAALASDIMTEAISPKTANSAIGSLRMTLGAIEARYRFGSGQPVGIESDNHCVPIAHDPLKLEEAKLAARLEQIRRELASR